MKKTRITIRFTVFFAAVIAVLFILNVERELVAGPAKSGGSYDINDDSMTASGAPGITGATYWLIFSAGQPIGHEDMSGGSYDLEGGYISGVTAVFQIVKTVQTIDVPPGYTGFATDKVPGGRLTYKVEFTNYGEGANNTLIEDTIPSTMTFDAGSIELILNKITTSQTDASDGGECAYQVATSSIHCLIPDIGAGATGAVVFKAIII